MTDNDDRFSVKLACALTTSTVSSGVGSLCYKVQTELCIPVMAERQEKKQFAWYKNYLHFVNGHKFRNAKIMKVPSGNMIEQTLLVRLIWESLFWYGSGDLSGAPITQMSLTVFYKTVLLEGSADISMLWIDRLAQLGLGTSVQLVGDVASKSAHEKTCKYLHVMLIFMTVVTFWVDIFVRFKGLLTTY